MTEAGANRNNSLASAFNRIGQALASSLDLRDLLDLIVNQAMTVFAADVAILRLLDRPGELLELEVAKGVSEGALREVRFRPGEGLAGRVLLDGQPRRGANLQHDPRVMYRDLVRKLDLKSFAVVALHLHKQPIGVWFLIRRRQEPFSEANLDLLTTFADYASAAIERDRLRHTIVREKHESEAIIQASANGILVVNGYGQVVDMNTALERLVGWSLREARGQPCCDIVGCQLTRRGKTVEIPICPLKIGAEGRDRAFLEYQIQTREGRLIPVEASYGLIRNKDGELERVVMVFRDISHQEALIRQRAEIVANVSHELRTPLALIKGYASTLLNKNVVLDETETRRFLGNVSASADRLSRMIDDLLCASRLETDQLRLRPLRFDLGLMVHQMLDWFQPHAKGRHLVADVPAEELCVWADPDRVEQILINLLTNAAKYTPRNGTITIQARLLGDPPRAVVHVQDDGVGIAPEHLPRIFDRFYLTQDSKKGVGLGLYICKGLVQAMGGEIWVVSEVGQGSTFSFSLPVEASAAATVATQPI